MRWSGAAPTFDTTLQTPLQNTFFASIGFGASVLVLKRGGPLVADHDGRRVGGGRAPERRWAVSPRSRSVEHPLMGVLAGSMTLTGGPATGLAFAPLFEAGGRDRRGDARRVCGNGRHRRRRI